jgi:hypothetical protein
MKKIIALLLLFAFEAVFSQSLVWQDVTSNYALPQGIKVFHGTRTSPIVSIWYLDADLNNPKLAVRPYAASASQTLPSFTASVGAYAAINGGFFGGTSPFSAVIYPNEVKAANVQSVTRNSLSYPVVRSFFGMKKNRSFSVDWIYQFGNAMTDIYTYPQPLPYISNDPVPQAPPLKASGSAYSDLLVGIGGGPMLIKNDTINVTYNQELMWGSGVGETNGDPRTALGFTANKHVILMTADGRQTGSQGVGLPELAQILKSLGCTGAINLDGGGSTQMAVPNQYINSPSELRPVPAIFAIVSADSLNLPKDPLFQKIIDTGDTNATALGGGWFESANPGYWGTTKSQLHGIGTGAAAYEFRPHLPAKATYNVYGWWVASSNRSTDTPFIITRNGGVDTVLVDQTSNGSTWKLLGAFEFSGTSKDRVIISDAAKTNSYVVADAIKFESFDPNVATSVETPASGSTVRSFELFQNYPNPFNPSTLIRYALAKASMVSIRVFSSLGAEVTTLVHQWQAPGSYEIRFDASSLPSGQYFYQLRTDDQHRTRRMLFIK